MPMHVFRNGKVLHDWPNRASEEEKVIELSNSEDCKFQKAKLTWKIKNYERKFSYSKATEDKCLTSDNFKVIIPSDSGARIPIQLNFCLQLYWNHEEKEKKKTNKHDDVDKSETCKSIGIYLTFLPEISTLPEVILKFNLSAKLNNGGSWDFLESEPRKFCRPDATSWGCSDLVEKEEIRETKGLFDEEGAFTVVCDIEILYKLQMKSKNKVSLYKPLSLSEELQMATKTKDVILIPNCDDSDDESEKEDGKDIEEEQILCHKFILTTRSDVFNAMFSHDTAENQTNTIVIEDTPKDVLQEFVDYLYTDKSESLASNDIDDIGAMLRLAEKYNVLSLKQRCEKRLLELIKSSTVDEIYKLAYYYNCEPVEKAITSFIADNLDAAFKSGWMKNFNKQMQDNIMKDVWALKLETSTE